ncbi:MAG: hypothetical protein LPK15_06245 [Alteromonadaceae bacterium]|uniref:hypothetical protein n=1 Tax=Marinobacter sp. TaxID=50741 RepID=UPI0029C29682|nr:hypothetical protein [Marinobacter sp.]MDX5385787.1 hypothetical protein [Marinobacter sp.]MDX5440032.1 hypothetical protein [Alteromonadaceae bacterium]
MSSYVFGAGLVLSQFYFFKSGIPQPAHFLMVLPFLFYLLRKRPFVILPRKEEFPSFLIVFFLYVASVNLFYAIYLQDYKFIFPVVYFLYGLVVYFVLQNIILYNNGLSIINIALFSGLVVLFLMAITGLGNYRFFPRYNAFFNDPNQMAFWALCVSSMLLAQRSLNDLLKGLVFLCLFYIILKSASRSGLVGFSVLVLGFLVAYVGSALSVSNFKKLAGVFLGVSLVVGLGYVFVKDNIETITFVESRLNQVDVGAQAGVRGYTRFLDYPEYIFLGAGQGAEIRFDPKETEIHSTWAGLLFYYGIPGLLLMLGFILKIVRRLSLSQKLIFAAPLLYSFSTLGYRTPIFWVFLAFFFCLTILQDENRRRKVLPGYSCLAQRADVL